jgi:hypothetical protein
MTTTFPRWMRSTARVVMLIFWLELGLLLVLVPWSDVWEANYFLYKYPAWALFLNSTFLRGAVSGLGLLNVALALGEFRRRTSTVAIRP